MAETERTIEIILKHRHRLSLVFGAQWLQAFYISLEDFALLYLPIFVAAAYYLLVRKRTISGHSYVRGDVKNVYFTVRLTVRGGHPPLTWCEKFYPFFPWNVILWLSNWILLNGLEMLFWSTLCHCPSEHWLSIWNFTFSLGLFVTNLPSNKY